MNKNIRNIILCIVLPLIIFGTAFFFMRYTNATAQTKYNEIVRMVLNNEISEYQLNLYSGNLKYTLRKDNKTYNYTVASPDIFYNDVNS